MQCRHPFALAALLLAAAGAGCTRPQPEPPAPVRGPCEMRVPEAPDPLPDGFDWQPLAVDWCAQLSRCGYPTLHCVRDYLAVIDDPPSGVPSLGNAERVELAIEAGVCEDSLEAQTDPAICEVEVLPQAKPRAGAAKP